MALWGQLQYKRFWQAQPFCLFWVSIIRIPPSPTLPPQGVEGVRVISLHTYFHYIIQLFKIKYERLSSNYWWFFGVFYYESWLLLHQNRVIAGGIFLPPPPLAGGGLGRGEFGTDVTNFPSVCADTHAPCGGSIQGLSLGASTHVDTNPRWEKTYCRLPAW